MKSVKKLFFFASFIFLVVLIAIFSVCNKAGANNGGNHPLLTGPVVESWITKGDKSAPKTWSLCFCSGAAFKTSVGKEIWIVENDGKTNTSFKIKFNGRWITTSFSCRVGRNSCLVRAS